MHDKVLNGTLHELRMVQRKHQLHDVPQLDLGRRVRAPEEEPQAAQLPLELLVPRDQQQAERVVHGFLRRTRCGRQRGPASLPLAPSRDVENYVVIWVSLAHEARCFDHREDRQRILDKI